MTLEEAIEHCEEVADKNECKMTSDDGYTDVSMKRCAEEHRQLAELLKEFKQYKEKALEQTRWIPVSERLPKEVGTYLITLKDGDVSLCDFNPYCFADRTSLSIVAIAWMPLPTPYKAESEV